MELTFPNLCRTFWRGACVVISCGVPFFIFLYYFNKLDDWLRDKYSDDEWKTMIFELIYSLLFYGGVLLYCLARGYIIVESFISVRSLPTGAYKSVDWIDFWAHM